MANISYHGTSKSDSLKIAGPPTNVDISLGKGELGKGFYTGSSIALAAIWAYSRFQDQGEVIEFDIPKSEFVKLRGKTIKKKSSLISLWSKLKNSKKDKSYIAGYDYIIAPFATIEETGFQLKFESIKSQNCLNQSDIKVYSCV